MWKVIINPTAGSGKAKKRKSEILAKLKAANIPHEVAMTERQGHATELCKTAIEQGFRQIIVVGGDGSNHEVMNGIMQQNVVPTHEITQCLIPVGTGNDWIRTHELPRNIDKIIKNIKSGKTKLQDIGKATFMKDGVLTERYFMNVAGLAYDAFIAKKSNENPKSVSNKIYYLYLILRCLFQYEPQKTRVTFQEGKTQQTLENKYYTINIGICKYSGGGMQFVPHAIPDNGLFALTTVESMSVAGVFAATPYLYGGRISKHRKSFLTETNYVKVESLDNEAVMLELDGEFVGVSPIEFEVVTEAFRFVV
jgi:diacylglycerol kinase (ATP)